MKAIKCEMCGSNNVIKNDGYYTCQSCGTKYSVEEAKKLLVEGVVKIDNSDKVERLYQLARTARDNTDVIAAKNYYEQIKIEKPNDWEANYFSLYYRLLDITLGEIVRSADTMFNSIPTFYSLIDNYCADNKEKTLALGTILVFNKGLAKIMYDGAFNMANTNFVNDYSSDSLIQDYLNKTGAIANMLYATVSLGDTFAKRIDNENKLNSELADCALYSVQLRVNMFRLLADKGSSQQKIIDECMAIVRTYRSNCSTPTENANYNAYIKQRFQSSINTGYNSSNGGCYIATAVYGSYDCPQVWTLRRYRDYSLAKSWHGRAFIKAYYAVSPMLVRQFGKTKWFNKLFKRKLDIMVSKLQKRGFVNTPYHD